MHTSMPMHVEWLREIAVDLVIRARDCRVTRALHGAGNVVRFTDQGIVSRATYSLDCSQPSCILPLA